MGLNSFLETAFHGIPVLSIPLFVDQYHNSHCSQAKGLAIVLDKTKLTKEYVEENLKRLLEDPRLGS
jgi:glucuronosyltransferase